MKYVNQKAIYLNCFHLLGGNRESGKRILTLGLERNLGAGVNS
jgi:hypothetical protein